MIIKLIIRLLLNKQPTYSKAVKVDEKIYLISIEQLIEPQVWIEKAKEQIGLD